MIGANVRLSRSSVRREAAVCFTHATAFWPPWRGTKPGNDLAVALTLSRAGRWRATKRRWRGRHRRVLGRRMKPELATILQLLDDEHYPVLLLGWPLGSKGTRRKWGHLTAKAMRDPRYLHQLDRGNVGVALGPVSGNLVSVDVDDDDGFSEFVQLNAVLADTLQSKGRRGGNIWWRMQGVYPRLQKLKRHGCDWGEWRSTGGQTIIYGQHPDGREYTITNPKPPLSINFEQILWPDGVAPPKSAEALQKSTDSRLPSSSVLLCPPLSSSVNSVEEAVAIALPSVPNQNHSHLFTLARAIKTLELRDGSFQVAERVHIFRQWYEQAKARGVLRERQSRDEYLAEFLRAYRKAKFPIAMNQKVLKARELAMSEPPPPAASVFESPEARLLVSICCQLHVLAAGEEWYLSARTAGRLVGTSHTTAAACIAAMVDLEILKVVKPGTTIKAARYAYAHNHPAITPTASTG